MGNYFVLRKIYIYTFENRFPVDTNYFFTFPNFIFEKLSGLFYIYFLKYD